jgi:mannose-6-phosphate isomerase-like protein (cupin superfamily)
MGKKYEKCIVTRPKIVDDLPKHVVGKYQILMNAELVPNADFFIVGGTHTRIHQAEPIEKHSHDVSEAYLFIGKKGAAEIEVELDDEKYVLESPGAVYVPKGVEHLFRYLRIDGPVTVVAIVQSGTYIAD